ATRAARRMRLLRTFLHLVLALLTSTSARSAPLLQPETHHTRPNPAVEADVAALLARMTLEEKIGQLNFPSLAFPTEAQLEDVRKGRIGAILNVVHPDHIAKFKRAAAQSRLKIPLFFAIDAVHFFRITFPAPIAWAATWR